MTANLLDELGDLDGFETTLEGILTDLEQTNKLLSNLIQLSSEMKSKTESLCEEPISAKELDERICPKFQDKFNQLGNLWWDSTADLDIKHKKLSEIILYYLLRDGEPNLCVKQTICELWNNLQTALNPYQRAYYRPKFVGSMPNVWYTLFNRSVGAEAVSQHFYNKLGNRPSTFFWLVSKRPQLLTNQDSHQFVEILKKHASYDLLNRILKETKNETGQTLLFHTYDLTFLKIYDTHLEDLYKLLSIQDNEGNTAFHTGRNGLARLDEAIGFSKTDTAEHRERLIRLLSTQNARGKTMMFLRVGNYSESCERVKDLYGNYLPDLYKLLSIQDAQGKTALFHFMYELHNILRETYDPKYRSQLVDLLTLTNEDKQTYLFSTYIGGDSFGNSDVEWYMEVFGDRMRELWNLLSTQDKDGKTVLFEKLYRISPLLEKVNDPKYFAELKNLLSITDKSGKTALFCNSARFFTDFFSDHIDDFCELLSIQDNDGRTAIHANPRSMCNAMGDLYHFKHREEYHKLLSIKDKNGKTAQEILECDDGSLSFFTAILKNNRYLLRVRPIVLIFYFTRKRPWAKEEATMLFDELETYKTQRPAVFKDPQVMSFTRTWESDKEKIVSLEPDRREYEMTKLIKETAEKYKYSALIVFILSHGKVGSIIDCDEVPVSISQIEKAMCENGEMEGNGNPKILITQCCQIGQESEKNPPYSPTHDHFFAAMSCVPGQPSERGVFINKLVQRIKEGSDAEPITKTIADISEEMEKDGHQQTPLVMSTLKAEFPLIAELRRSPFDRI